MSGRYDALIEGIVNGKPKAVVEAFEQYVNDASQYEVLALCPKDFFEEVYADWIEAYADNNPELIERYTGWRSADGGWTKDGETVDIRGLAQRLKSTRHPQMMEDFRLNFDEYAFGWSPEELREEEVYDHAMRTWLQARAEENPQFFQAVLEQVLSVSGFQGVE